MRKKYLWFVLAGLVILIAGGIFAGLASLAAVPEAKLWEGAAWVDDWYACERVDDQTVIIGEPKYWQYNINYLIMGRDRAIVFDTGPGKRDITPIVRKFTALPLMAASSHVHFDHIGNQGRFAQVALADFPSLRARVHNGLFQPTAVQTMDLQRHAFHVTAWWKPGDIIDLGDRRLEVVPVPGHTPDSIALVDHARNMIFVGDFIYAGGLVAYTPGADLASYLATTRKLLALTDEKTVILCAHNAPRLDRSALVELEQVLLGIGAGTAPWEWDLIFRRYRLSPRLSVVTGSFPPRTTP